MADQSKKRQKDFKKTFGENATERRVYHLRKMREEDRHHFISASRSRLSTGKESGESSSERFGGSGGDGDGLLGETEISLGEEMKKSIAVLPSLTEATAETAEEAFRQLHNALVGVVDELDVDTVGFAAKEVLDKGGFEILLHWLKLAVNSSAPSSPQLLDAVLSCLCCLSHESGRWKSKIAASSSGELGELLFKVFESDSATRWQRQLAIATIGNSMLIACLTTTAAPIGTAPAPEAVLPEEDDDFTPFATRALVSIVNSTQRLVRL
eukprot:GHVU01061584.1.p1 GENE.GHVU01061584.1~~GHVU01061584.1.p1  ORF type:complete len:268 (-),score=35.65 GHVU01061584.1:736-1539(-)